MPSLLVAKAPIQTPPLPRCPVLAPAAGCPANATELGATNQTGSLSPACVARTLSLTTGQGGFGRMNANTVQPRIWQFALKFYF